MRFWHADEELQVDWTWVSVEGLEGWRVEEAVLGIEGWVEDREKVV
jgi:hypothetical protein